MPSLLIFLLVNMDFTFTRQVIYEVMGARAPVITGIRVVYPRMGVLLDPQVPVTQAIWAI
jgi:hypothetical protein